MTENISFISVSPFAEENQRRRIEHAILISQDSNYGETVRTYFARRAQELLAQLNNGALRDWITDCEFTEDEAIHRGNAGCDAEPGFAHKCVESATIGRALLVELLRRDLNDPDEHMLRSWLPPVTMCEVAE
jgi:hypothetical protein